jgi:hypothetical protein
VNSLYQSPTLYENVASVLGNTWTKNFLGVLLALLLTTNGSFAQVSTADVLGTITDSSNAIVANATITITNTGTGETRRTKANDSGEYLFPALPVGSYALTIEMPGFEKLTIPNVTLSQGDRARVNGHLKVGSETQTVEVTGAGPELQTDSSTVGFTVTPRAVEDLPLNGRNFIELAQTVAGANEGPPNALSGGTRPDDRRQSSSISANGQDEYLNNELVDGLDNNQRMKGGIGVRPSIDGIAEFRVQTNVYTAEVGRTAGAVINIITKSGTNDLHGSAYEFFRNNIFDASDYFAVTKPELRQNQFGGSLGGPIMRDRLFFFADYEGLRLVSGQTSTLTVPTLYEEQHPGDFSDRGEEVVPVADLNPIALKYFQLYPAPTRPGLASNFTSNTNNLQYAHTGDARVDYIRGASDRFFARYTVNNVFSSVPGPLPIVDGIAPGGNYNGFPGTSQQPAQSVQLNYTHIFTPTTLLELKAGFIRINNSALQLNYGSNASTAFGLSGVNVSTDTSGLAPMGPTGFASVGDGTYLPIHDLDNIFQEAGQLTLVRGTHNFKFGGALIRVQAKADQSTYGIGLFTYSAETVDGVTCEPISCFLRGLPYQVQRSNQLYPPNLRTWEPAGYAQDDWRATPWLTLNLGLRYDVFTPYVEVHNHIANFDPATATILVAGQNGVSRTAGVSTDYGNVAPRIGFAATVQPGTVLRGGYGISYFSNMIGLRLALGNPPYTFTYAPLAQSTTLSEGLPVPVAQSTSVLSGALAGIQRNYRSMYIQQYNLTLEQAFGQNTFTVTYVGELGKHLRIYTNINLAPPAPRGCTAPSSSCYKNYLPYASILPNVTTISLMQSSGYSNYQALQATFARRFSRGLGFNANYTWANQIDDSPNYSVGASGNGVIPSQFGTVDRGLSDLNVRHRIAVTFNYALPAGGSLHGLRGLLAKDWQLNGLYRWDTGLPFSVTDGTAYSNTGVGSGGERARQLHSPMLANPSVHEWFDTSAFVSQTFGTYVPMRRNSVEGPNFRALSASAFKTVPLTERFSAEFRAEGFNVLNTPNFAAPDSRLGDAALGQITASRANASPRQIQFALKLLF